MRITYMIEKEKRISDKIDQAAVKSFFEFCRKHADFLSITRPHTKELTKRQVDLVMNELEQDVAVQINNFRINKDGYADRLKQLLFIETEEDAKLYFKDIKRENKKIISELKHQKFDGRGLDIDLLANLGMIKMNITCISPITKGPLVDICYFRSNALKQEIDKLTDIFAPIEINNHAFEDLTFYKEECNNESAFIMMITHEGEIELILDEKSFQEITSLGLPYSLRRL